jgi:hypothetical protein
VVPCHRTGSKGELNRSAASAMHSPRQSAARVDASATEALPPRSYAHALQSDPIARTSAEQLCHGTCRTWPGTACRSSLIHPHPLHLHKSGARGARIAVTSRASLRPSAHSSATTIGAPCCRSIADPAVRLLCGAKNERIRSLRSRCCAIYDVLCRHMRPSADRCGTCGRLGVKCIVCYDSLAQLWGPEHGHRADSFCVW